MKLYVWDDWKTDWTAGCVVVLARDIRQARSKLKEYLMKQSYDKKLNAYDKEEMNVSPKVYATDQSRVIIETIGGS